MTSDSSKNINTYSAKTIKVLKGLEGVRIRPDMYIGNTQDGSGLHRMVFEIIDNCVDEFPHCNKIEVALASDGTITVTDNGRGIPVDMHFGEGKPALEVIFTELHSGGKFEDSADTYQCSGGLHGLGASIVNALSTTLTATVWRNDKEYKISFANGIKQHDMLVAENKTERKSGTQVSFKPSPEIFGENHKMSPSILRERLNEIGYLNSGLTLVIVDESHDTTENIQFPNGLGDFLDLIRKNSAAIAEPIRIESKTKECSVSIIMQWLDVHHENGLCFTNFVRQREGGTHLTGFRSAITRVMNKIIEEKQEEIKKIKIESILGDDMRDGLYYIISLRLKQPKFSSQTKEKLVNEEARSFVDSIVSSQLSIWLEEHPSATDLIMKKMLLAAHAREAAKKARDAARKSKIPIDSFTLPGKLAGCREKNPALTELFIVEGDSAGGPAKAARMRETQAVLPVRGKILNVEKTNEERARNSDTVRSILASVGTGIGESFDLSTLRYGKIILMADADVDGAHIRTLMLTLFYRYMRQVIENGHLYVAKPPLYRVRDRNKNVYLDDEAQLLDYTLDVATEVIKLKDRTGLAIANGISKDIFLMADKIYTDLHKRGAAIDILEILAAETVHYVFADKDWRASDLSSSDTKLTDQIAETVRTVLQNQYAKEHKWEAVAHQAHVELTATDSLGCVINIIVQLKEKVIDYIARNLPKYTNSLDELRGYYLKHKDKSIKIDCLSSIAHIMYSVAKDVLQINRFKGLGEMQVSQLWETAMNPETRKLVQISIDDAQEAEDVFNKLMGSEAENRRIFIEEYTPPAEVDIDI